MSHSTPSTISALMKTCHLHYREGPKHLLQDGVVLYPDGYQVSRFIQFIFAQDRARFAHFRKLEIASGYMPDDIIKPLAELLGCPELSLETLILREAEPILMFDRFSSSLRATNPVKNLILLHSGPRTCSALQSVRVPLVNLTVSFMRYNVTQWRPGDPWSHLIGALSSHAQTLETLRCDSCPPGQAIFQPQRLLPGTSTPFTPVPSPPVRFGAVRTLGFGFGPGGQVDLASLVHTFPNVTSLELIPNPFDPSTVPGNSFSGSSVDGKRAILDRDDCWAVLTKCSGELASLYSLGIACHVADLCVWGEVQGDETLVKLATVISTVRPKCLRLSGSGLRALGGLTSCLRKPEFEMVETLHLVITMTELYKGDGSTEVDMTEHIFAAFDPLPPQMRTLELFIEFEGTYVHTPKPDNRALQELGRRLKEATPTLTHVLVRHADGYKLEPPNGMCTENDEGDWGSDGVVRDDFYGNYYSDDSDSWGHGDSDGYDSDCGRSLAYDEQ
ncbi:hypothetical protein C8T65DRAFT_696409 [Cerioporus squamosus]|nr:hypothetical protein C8T65DRAFT_696409 [Cerioporus squamosus]